jgi:hypothetical protein
MPLTETAMATKLLFVALLFSASPVFAQDSASGRRRDSLRGINEIGVLVDSRDFWA